MSDPLRTDSSRAQEAAPEADREAKIEQLLLLGLDHYFAAQYEQAINVWTRVLFLDRTHARARAYIERARSGLAERQRESEELLQKGVAAFSRGEPDEARRLLQAAIDLGAPSEEALAVLDRLNRLETTGAKTAPEHSRSEKRSPSQPATKRRRRRIAVGLITAVILLLCAGLAGVYVTATWERVDWPAWLTLPRARATGSVAPVSREMLLPMPRRGEIALTRARSLAASGHLHDALAALDLVRPTDPQKPDADRLRSEIQRQLLGLSSTTRP